MPKSSLRNNLMREMIAPQSGLDNNPKAKLIPLERLASNPFQVRQDFSSDAALEALQELADDIKQHGILQPLIVRPIKSGENNGKFEIVAGERRYRAAGMAGLSEVPVIIEDYNDEEARLVSLTENLQRRDLTFAEEVNFLTQLDHYRGVTFGKGGDTDLSEIIHKSRTYVIKRLKLAKYPELVREITEGRKSINAAYDEAIEREKIFQPESEEPEAEEAEEELPPPKSERNLQARLIVFSRLRESLPKISSRLNKLSEQDRLTLKNEIDELEKELQELRAKL